MAQQLKPHPGYAFTYNGWSMLDCVYPQQINPVFVKAFDPYSSKRTAHQELEENAKDKSFNLLSMVRAANQPPAKSTAPTKSQTANSNGPMVYVTVGYTTIHTILDVQRDDSKYFQNRDVIDESKRSTSTRFGTAVPPLEATEPEPRNESDAQPIRLSVVVQYDPKPTIDSRMRRLYVLLYHNGGPDLVPFIVRKEAIFFRAQFRDTQPNCRKRKNDWYEHTDRVIENMKGGRKAVQPATTATQVISDEADMESQKTESDSESDSPYVPENQLPSLRLRTARQGGRRTINNALLSESTPSSTTAIQSNHISSALVVDLSNLTDEVSPVIAKSESKRDIVDHFTNPTKREFNRKDAVTFIKRTQQLWQENYPDLENLTTELVLHAKVTVGQLNPRLVTIQKHVVPAFLVHCLRHPDPSWNVTGNTYPVQMSAFDRFDVASAIGGPQPHI